MIFYDENNNIVNHHHMEAQEQELANTYVEENDVVLELGARYGTVSCTISKKLNNNKNLVVVEPDERVWDALEKNKNVNGCDFHIVKGFISNKKLNLTNKDVCYGYGTTFTVDETTSIPSYSLDEITTNLNLKFNVLIADCEGFLEVFFDENPSFYDNLRLVIFEADYDEKCNYQKIRFALRNRNFVEVVRGTQNVWRK
ncbi:MAG: putative methyltransferase [Terrestrivirus sp.]|uniref:Putative methyltransferase n=1 Tax=Terrestrivirus sp. TaxID=2487775 RepID=A0A3G4ZNW2_9VIRU|nr:MAG: putative methyltransferase [Terrestrivirus sp.]